MWMSIHAHVEGKSVIENGLSCLVLTIAHQVGKAKSGIAVQWQWTVGA